MNHHSSSNIKTAFFLNLFFALVELVGGFFINSVAIMSDALHDFGDSLSLGLSWFLIKKSQKPSDNKYSFGYQRFSLLGALINSIILVTGSVFILSEAIERFIRPEVSNAPGMIFFALMGISINGFAAYKLYSGKTLNEKVAFLHMLEDVLGWVAVLIAGIILLFTNNPYIDPALSVIITLYILWNVIKRLHQMALVFMQGVPVDINIADVEKIILSINKVKSLHHTHLWSLDGEQNVFTSHIKLRNIDSFHEFLEIKKQLGAVMNQFDFRHHTLELELDQETCRLAEKKDE